MKQTLIDDSQEDYYLYNIIIFNLDFKGHFKTNLIFIFGTRRA